MDSSKVRTILEGQELLLNDQFATADSLYREYIDRAPEDPAGHLFRAAGLMAEMSGREANLHHDMFHALLDSAESLADQMLDTCSPRIAGWMYLFRGHSKAYRSLWESRFGSLLSAVKLGLSANREYENGLKFDGSLYDLYAGTGSYHYWKSAKAGLLRWLGIFKNEKDKGIAELYLAADSSLLHRQSARSALIWIRLDKKQYDSVIVMASQFVQKYPDGLTFLWPIAQAWFRQERYGAALEVYMDIREQVAESPGNYFNLLECDYFICKCHNWLSQPDRAKAIAERAGKYHGMIPGETLKRQRARIDFLKRVALR